MVRDPVVRQQRRIEITHDSLPDDIDAVLVVQLVQLGDFFLLAQGRVWEVSCVMVLPDEVEAVKLVGTHCYGDILVLFFPILIFVLLSVRGHLEVKYPRRELRRRGEILESLSPMEICRRHGNHAVRHCVLPGGFDLWRGRALEGSSMPEGAVEASLDRWNPAESRVDGSLGFVLALIVVLWTKGDRNVQGMWKRSQHSSRVSIFLELTIQRLTVRATMAMVVRA